MKVLSAYMATICATMAYISVKLERQKDSIFQR